MLKIRTLDEVEPALRGMGVMFSSREDVRRELCEWLRGVRLDDPSDLLRIIVVMAQDFARERRQGRMPQLPEIA